MTEAAQGHARAAAACSLARAREMEMGQAAAALVKKPRTQARPEGARGDRMDLAPLLGRVTQLSRAGGEVGLGQAGWAGRKREMARLGSEGGGSGELASAELVGQGRPVGSKETRRVFIISALGF